MEREREREKALSSSPKDDRARKDTSGPPRRGLSKPVVCPFPQFPLCRDMPSCSGQWSGTSLSTSKGNSRGKWLHPRAVEGSGLLSEGQ